MGGFLLLPVDVRLIRAWTIPDATRRFLFSEQAGLARNDRPLSVLLQRAFVPL
jgi:hypothetical protein